MTVSNELRELAPLAGHWFHSIELEPGLWTNGIKTKEQMNLELVEWGFPADLTGKTVLDIGCADGGWSVAALRRGAKSVLAIDEQMTTGMRHLQEAKAFPQIEFRQINLFSNEFLALPKFDFIIFAGILYHIQDMLEALKRVRSRANGQVLVETHVNESAGKTPPLAVYYEKSEYAGDPTNWWGPNILCLEAMFRTAGFAFKQNGLGWEDDTHANGRIAYTLDVSHGSVFGDVTESATGSNNLLEEARLVITRLHEENYNLKVQIGMLTEKLNAKA